VRVQTHAADLAAPGDLAGLERVIAAAGPDLLVNNAGFAGYREFCQVDPTVISDLLACTSRPSPGWPGRQCPS
jgi:short-subunit dehydrogenase